MSKFAGRELVLRVADAALGVTSVASTDLFTAASNHGLSAGDIVVFSGLTGGAGLVPGTRYYVISAGLTATVFAVSATPGGSSFDHTTNVTAGSFVSMEELGQVTALGDAGSSRDLIDASAYGEDWKDYVVGQQDGSEVEVDIAYDPADDGHDALLAAYNGGEPEQFEMQHADAGFHVGFPALVTKLERGAPRDGLLHMAATLKILSPGVEDIT
jgi:hypothetical protein